jgi:hypothetical protein
MRVSVIRLAGEPFWVCHINATATAATLIPAPQAGLPRSTPITCAPRSGRSRRRAPATDEVANALVRDIPNECFDDGKEQIVRHVVFAYPGVAPLGDFIAPSHFQDVLQSSADAPGCGSNSDRSSA